MEDHGIAEIEKAAHSYVDARDERMKLTEEEARRHTKVVAVMKKHGKKTYKHRNGEEIVEIKMTVKDPEERAKVKIRPVTDDDLNATSSEPEPTGDEGSEAAVE